VYGLGRFDREFATNIGKGMVFAFIDNDVSERKSFFRDFLGNNSADFLLSSCKTTQSDQKN
jgi:hypothetical protein